MNLEFIKSQLLAEFTPFLTEEVKAHLESAGLLNNFREVTRFGSMQSFMNLSSPRSHRIKRARELLSYFSDEYSIESAPEGDFRKSLFPVAVTLYANSLPDDEKQIFLMNVSIE